MGGGGGGGGNASTQEVDRFCTNFNDYKPRNNKFPLDPAIAICRQVQSTDNLQ